MMRKSAAFLLLFFCLSGWGWAKTKVLSAEHFVGRTRNQAHTLVIMVQNLDTRPLDYEVEISSYGGFLLTVPGAALRPGERRRLTIPVFGQHRYFRCRVRDSSGYTSSQDSMRGQPRAILHLAPLTQWLDAASQEFLKEAYFCAGRSSCRPEVYEDEPDILLQDEPGHLPENWLCLLSFQALVMPEDVYSKISPEGKGAISRYLNSGGSLYLYGSPQAGREERLMGSIIRLEENPLKGASLPDRLSARSMYANMGEGRVERNGFPYVPKQVAGALAGLVLATLFFVLAGPVNYAYFKRRKRPRALLVSLPAISVIFCLLIVVLFFASKGFSRRGGSLSVTLVDEAHKAALCTAHHLFLSGLYPRDGLVFDASTGFFPKVPENAAEPVMELGGKLHLLSGLIMPSVPFSYATDAPYTTREKLIIDGDQARNGFSFPIEGMVLRKGGEWYEAGPMAPGGAARLSPTRVDLRGKESPIAVAHNIVNKLRGRGLISSPEAYYMRDNILPWLAPGFLARPDQDAYFFLTKAPPPGSWPGLSMDSEKQKHLFIGKAAGGKGGEERS